MKTILITGGAGFIGSHSSLQLLELGFKVIVLDSFVNSSPKLFERIRDFLASKEQGKENNLEIVEGDIRNEYILDHIFEKSLKDNSKIDAVIHFAGLKSVPESFLKEKEYWEVNVEGSKNLLKVMHKYNCKSLVFSSSAAVYSAEHTENIHENAKLLPSSPYGKTKLAVENLINDLFINSKDWNVISLRYFNPIGAHPLKILGECPKGKPSNIFPYLLQVANGQREFLEVYGNDWNTVDGTTVRDYIHISDLVEGHSKALNFVLENNRNNLLYLNLGQGKGTSILELIKTFEKATGCTIPYKFTNSRIGDVAVRIASNKLAFKVLNWKPKKDVFKMCIDGWQWHKNNPFGY